MPTNLRLSMRMRRLLPLAWLCSLLLAGLWRSTDNRPAMAQVDTSSHIAVVVELAEPSVIEQMVALNAAGTFDDRLARQAAKAQLQRVADSQSTMTIQLRAAGATEIYRVQRVYNGIAVRIPADRADALRQLPGVRAVHPLIAKRPTHATSLPFIGAPALWSSQGVDRPSATGAGVKIAVIDTGIDYLHRDFGGPGGGYFDNDVRQLGDVPGFPSAKIVGGYDFVGDRYNADPDDDDFQPIPNPDPDPYDCYGHGTHVAGTAAGYGVTNNGETYGGPYDATLDLSAMTVAPGVAPEAQLFALKVFGCTGATELTDAAIEWAVDPNGDGDFRDRVDVINLSLGSVYGDRNDTTALAANRAALAGVAVVASAGNSGDSYFAVGSPSVADHVISVAAVGLARDAGDTRPTMASFSSRGPRGGDGALKPDVAAPGRGIRSALAHSGSGSSISSGTSMAAPHVAGGVALLRQLDPTLSVAALKSLVMTTARDSVNETESPTLAAPSRLGAGVLDLPAAAASPLLAYAVDAPGQIGLSFGLIDAADPLTRTRVLRVVNRSQARVRITPTLAMRSELPGATVTLTPSMPMTLTGGASQNFTVQLAVDPAKLSHLSTSPGPLQNGAGHWVAELSGQVRFQTRAVDGTPLPTIRVPVHAAPRPIAELNAAGPLTLGQSKTATLTVSGRALAGTTPPTDVLSLLSLFELTHISPPKSIEEDPRAAENRHGDLRYIGVSSWPDIGTSAATSAATSIEEEMLFFGVAMQGPWSSPNDVEVSILVDTDGDGLNEYVVFNSNDKRYDDDRGYSDRFLVAIYELRDDWRRAGEPLNLRPAAELETRLFNSSVMVLPVKAGDIGLRAGNPTFRYRVVTHLDGNPVPYDMSPYLFYNLRQPGIRPERGELIPIVTSVENGWSLPLVVDAEDLGRNRSSGVLVFLHHNATEAQSQAVALDLDLPNRVYLPLAAESDGQQSVGR
jgi:subtilisin family serine protease